jgi:hypothetical protein
VGIHLSEQATGMLSMAATGLVALVIYLASRRWLPLLSDPINAGDMLPGSDRIPAAPMRQDTA